MSTRSLKERVIQALTFEFGGLTVALPLYYLVFGGGAAKSLAVLVAISVVVLLWMPIHNTVFDKLEWRWSGRLASDRPHWLRIGHAVSLECTSILLSLPFVMVLGGHGFVEALIVSFSVAALYVAYGYLFNLIFDRVRPVTSSISSVAHP